MSTFFRRSSVLALAFVLSLFGNAVIAPAQSVLPVDKHAHKMQKELAKHPQGSYLRLELADGSDAYGALGPMSETGFNFTGAETNSSASYRFSDVSKVKTDKQRIGHGSEPFHIRHLRSIAITGAVVAAGAITYSAVR